MYCTLDGSVIDRPNDTMYGAAIDVTVGAVIETPHDTMYAVMIDNIDYVVTYKSNAAIHGVVTDVMGSAVID